MDMVQQYPIVSDQITRSELKVILRELQAALQAGVSGDVVEFGCYVGTTSLFLQRALQGANRRLHVYDSFAGLPPKSTQDNSPAGEQFKAGKLATSKTVLINHFKRAHLPLPYIHKAWFDELSTDDLPERIAFAFLDGDFYQSILTSLRLVWSRLSSGAVVVVDDYHTEALPGVRQALDEWAVAHPFTLRVEASLAIVKLTDT
jgi:O-methyltransferase